MKTKRILAVILSVLMLLSVVPMTASAETTGEHLTEVPEGYIGIYTIEDLYCVRNDLTANYILMNSIDLSEATAEGGDWSYGGRGWNPIGSDDKYSKLPFSGIFDGNGYSVTGMNISVVDSIVGYDTYLGLFANVSGTVKNLYIDGSIILNRTSTYGPALYVGSVAAYCSGTIENCQSNVKFNICKKWTGSTSNAQYDDSYVGGIVGSLGGSSGKIVSCINTGKMIVDVDSYNGNNNYCSGIAGYAGENSTIERCVNTADITVSVKGGHSYSYIYYTSAYVAGIAYDGYIKNCFNTANITSVAGKTYARAFSYGIAYYSSHMSACYNVGNIVGTNGNYAIADVGDVSASSGKPYYLSGSGVRGSVTHVELTESQMKLKSMYSGWDFDTVWTMDGREDYPYPELRSVALVFPGESTEHEHSYTSEITTPATHLKEGVETFTCECGDTYTETIEKIADHDYKAVVTAPTCTAQGYTTYTCECGDSYVADYVDSLGHSFVDYICTRCSAVELLASGTCGNNLTWTLDDEGTLTISGTGAMTNYSYASSVPWYSNRNAIKNLVIEDGVTTIGNSAFEDCGSLENITIPNSVTSIGNSAFYRCFGLDELTIQNPDCTIYDNANTIHTNTVIFGHDNSTAQAYAEKYDRTFVSLDGEATDIIFSGSAGENADFTITRDGKMTITGSGDMYSYSDSIDRPWYKYIRFIKSVSIENSITSIGGYAFDRCTNIVNITIPDSVMGIGSFAFQYCTSLETITIPDSVTSINHYVFYGCSSLVNITIPDNVTNIGQLAFYNCTSLVNITIPNSVTEIWGAAFSGCNSLVNITIPDSVTSIGSSAFKGCTSLTEITILNPDCSIFDYGSTISDTATIYGYDNSTAKSYARKYNRTFVALECDHANSTFVPGKAATCTKDGKTDGTVCNVCKVTTGSEVIPAFGHDYSSEITKQPTHEATGTEKFTCANCGDTYTETLPKLTGHAYNAVVTDPTCTAKGYTTYTCACGDSYVADYTDKLDHSYTSEITTPATHLTEGVETYTCECGDSYTLPVAKLEDHTYEAVVTAPTCTAQGYTTYTCECGDSYVADYTDKLDHSYTSEITTPATHLTEGVETFTCECGDSYTLPVAKLEDHTYEAVVTAPTCTKQGFTTYTCECGDSYVADYVDVIPHEYTSEITTPATHLKEGVMTYTCACGDTYTETIAKIAAHNHKSEITTPATHLKEGVMTYTCACGDTYTETIDKLTAHEHKAEVTTPATHLTTGVRTYTCACGDTYTTVIPKTTKHTYSAEVLEEAQCKKDGKMLYVCECGHSYTETIPETGHADEDDNNKCDHCGIKVCDHICHKDGILGIFWKIIRFFWKMCGTNPVCECGMAHY